MSLTLDELSQTIGVLSRFIDLLEALDCITFETWQASMWDLEEEMFHMRMMHGGIVKGKL